MKKFIKILFILTCIIIFIIFPKQAIEGARNGVNTSLWIILPSLLPFMVLSKWLLNQIVASSKVYSYFSFILGLISGYPLGAQLAINGLESGTINRAQAQKILNSCTNCGIFFIIGTVGNSLLHNNALGYKLFFAHVISAVCLFIWNNTLATTSPNAETPQNRRIIYNEGNVLFSSIKSISVVCGNIIIFSSFISILENFLPKFVFPIVEMASGISHVLNFPAFIAFAITFGGMCVAMQVKTIIGNRLSIRAYFVNKFMQGVIAFLAFIAINLIIL